MFGSATLHRASSWWNGLKGATATPAPLPQLKEMHLRLHALLALVVIAVSWLEPHATAVATPAVAELNAYPQTKEPPPSTPQHSLDENARRVEADDGIADLLVAAKTASSDHRVQSTSKATNKQVAGPAPAIVLAAGGAVIGIVALAFHKRRTRQSDKEGQDALRQSLLFHDMDYAAM